MLLMVYKALHGLAPQYISERLEYQPTRQLRSSSQNMLQIPKARTVRYGDRAFQLMHRKSGTFYHYIFDNLSLSVVLNQV